MLSNRWYLVLCVLEGRSAWASEPAPGNNGPTGITSRIRRKTLRQGTGGSATLWTPVRSRQHGSVRSNNQFKYVRLRLTGRATPGSVCEWLRHSVANLPIRGTPLNWVLDACGNRIEHPANWASNRASCRCGVWTTRHNRDTVRRKCPLHRYSGICSVCLGKLRARTAWRDLKLKGLKKFPELDGLAYSQLPTPLQNALTVRPYIRVTTLLKQSDSRLKYEVFLRLNTGGDKLKAQEIRNVAFSGPLNDLLFELSENQILKRQAETFRT